MAPTPTWETVLERNTVERIKLDKPPLGIRDELPSLIAGGYEALPEEDIVRLQWWGLYHDKPKIGTFMLRVKIPNGVLSAERLRTIGEVSNKYGRGGLSSVPRIARGLGVFGPKEEAVEIPGATTLVWSEDLKYRMSRVKARMKFMVDAIGADGMLERVEEKLGRTLERFETPKITAQPSAHIGVHAQKQDGLSYIGVPVQLGLTSGDQLIAVAELAESFGGDIRLTRQQNLIVTGVSDVDATLVQLDELG